MFTKWHAKERSAKSPTTEKIFWRDVEDCIWLSTYPTTNTRKMSPFDQSAIASIITSGIRHGETFPICFNMNKVFDNTCFIPYFSVSCFNAGTSFHNPVIHM